MYDFAVIGGGIVGLSTARALLQRYPGAGVLLLEKERAFARHQTGHNSGVIHSGVYYRPGSLKARFSKEGGARLVEFCRERGISYEVCGKVIVATEPEEMPRLKSIHERGVENGLAVEKLGPEGLRELEPHAAGLAALKVPSTGIVDFTGVAEALAEDAPPGRVASCAPAQKLRVSRRPGTGWRYAPVAERVSGRGCSSTAPDSTAIGWPRSAGSRRGRGSCRSAASTTGSRRDAATS